MKRLLFLCFTFTATGLAATGLTATDLFADEASSQPAPQPNVLVTPLSAENAPASLGELAASGYSGRENSLLRYGTPETFAELHGFLSIIASQSNAPHSHLNIDLAEAFLSAFAQVNRTIAVYIEFEIQHGDVHLERGFLDWEFVPHVHFQAGKFYAPFGNDKLIFKQPFNRLTTTPLVLDNLAFTDIADIGLWLYASHRWNQVWARADVAVVKGSSGLRDADWSFDENNADKPVFGRVQVGGDGTMAHGLVGVSAAYGKYDDGSHKEWMLFGANAQLTLWRFDFLAEIIARRGQDSTPSDSCHGQPCAPVRANGVGLYAYLSFHVLQNISFANDLEAVVRYDESRLTDINAFGLATEERRLTLGVRWKPYNHIAIKAEYNLAFSEPVEVHGGGFYASIVAEF